MSVCDPNSPDACDTCKAYHEISRHRPTQEAPVLEPSSAEWTELEDWETQLKALRIEARKLAKSGHPGVAAEGRRAEAKCDEDLAWVRSQLSKEQ